jgi:hypothetical protein
VFSEGQLALVEEAGVHPYTMALTFLGFIHFCLGYADQALAYQTAATAAAREKQHRPSMAHTLAMEARLLWLLGNRRLLAGRTEQLYAIGVEQGFPYWRAQGSIYTRRLARRSPFHHQFNARLSVQPDPLPRGDLWDISIGEKLRLFYA